MSDILGAESRDLQEEHPGEPKPGKTRSLWGDAFHELVRNPVFVVSAMIVLVVVLMALFPQWFAGDNPRPPNPNLLATAEEGPTKDHWLGFTTQGYPMYTQIVWGTRNSLAVALVATVGSTLVGMVFGIIAGYFGGATDSIISRLADIFFGLPFILGAVVFLAVFQVRSVWAISSVLVILGWSQLTRIMRGSTLEIKNRDYVEAARALGAGHFHIIRRHILPNASAPLFVLSTIAIGSYVSAEATLTFLGVGFRVPTVSWGGLISQGQSSAVYEGNWHLLVFPCAFLVITVLAFIMMGDALRDALDPRSR